jgi:hypothetical protein
VLFSKPSQVATSAPHINAAVLLRNPYAAYHTRPGLTGLLGIILLLSFGAYRVLDHFRKSAAAAPEEQSLAVV